MVNGIPLEDGARGANLSCCCGVEEKLGQGYKGSREHMTPLNTRQTETRTSELRPGRGSLNFIFKGLKYHLDSCQSAWLTGLIAPVMKSPECTHHRKEPKQFSFYILEITQKKWRLSVLKPWRLVVTSPNTVWCSRCVFRRQMCVTVCGNYLQRDNSLFLIYKTRRKCFAPFSAYHTQTGKQVTLSVRDTVSKTLHAINIIQIETLYTQTEESSWMLDAWLQRLNWYILNIIIMLFSSLHFCLVDKVLSSWKTWQLVRICISGRKWQLRNIMIMMIRILPEC